MMKVHGRCHLLVKMWCEFHIFGFKSCFIISHSLVPDFYVVLRFLLNSYFRNVTMLLNLLLCVFGVHIFSACVSLIPPPLFLLLVCDDGFLSCAWTKIMV
jgi:hypothetical protein